MKRTLAALALATASLAAAAPALAQETQLASLRAGAQGNDPQAQLALGRALRRSGHFDEAVTTLRRAARGPARNDALWEIARVRFDEGNFRASQSACAALPAGHGPHDAAGVLRHVCMARAHLVWHRVALAEREIAAARAIDPNNGELALVVADAHRLAAEVPQAEESYRAAAQALPGRVEPALGLGLLYETAQRMDDAQAAYRHAVETDEHDPEAQLALGRFLLLRRNDATGALPALRRAAAERASWPDALVSLGNAQLATGATTDALASFGQAAQLAPAQAGAQAGLGRARLANNQLPEAEQALRLAITQVANDAEAHMALAEVLGRTQRGEEALEEWNRAIDLMPQDPRPRMRAAEVSHGLGQNTLARAYVDRILSDDAHYAPALLLRADIAFEEHDRANARQLYQSALTGHGAIDRARAQARLAEIDRGEGRQRRR